MDGEQLAKPDGKRNLAARSKPFRRKIFPATDLSSRRPHCNEHFIAHSEGSKQPSERSVQRSPRNARAHAHERAYLDHLRSQSLTIVENPSSVEATVDAMTEGADVITQAHLADGRWHGRADVLLKVAAGSKLGAWSYEVVDTKLASETKAGTILQLCPYSELVGSIQDFLPEWMHVVSPGRKFEPETFRVHDYIAYHRFVKRRLEVAVDSPDANASAVATATYPEPVDHCGICDWWKKCDSERRADDHLSFVADIQAADI